MEQNLINKIIRMMKPEIALLLNIVAVAGFVTGLKDARQLYLIVPLLVAGTTSSFSASLFNSVIEYRSDLNMKRTAWRKVGEIRNIVLYVAIILLFMAVAVSYIFINIYTTVWIISGFLSYVLLYTVILKRTTSMNIVIGGISGSFPAMAGWSAVNSPLSITSLYLAGLVFLWTPVHFWSFAVKYRDDYRNAGIPMLPSIKPINVVNKYIVGNTIVLIGYSIIPFIFKGIFSINIMLVGSLAISTAILIYYLIHFLRDPIKNSIKMFSASNIFLLIFLLGIIIARVYP